jgi:N-acetylneuraminic acid mutarotase
MVLVAGGENSGGYLNSFETYDPVAGQWVIDCTFPESRSQHTATLLPNGQVLMAGGYNGSSFLNSAVLWDYAAGSWAFPSGLVHPNLYVYRDSHTATLLATGTNAGKVLVLGHYADLAVELFDPVTENWSLNGELLDYRGSPTATLLGSGPNAGKVLVVAGWSESGEVASTEIYDPGSGISVGAGDLSDARSGHTATLLADGRVLVAGGYGLITNDPEPIYDSLDSVELYEPHGGWTTVDSMQEGRSGHTATLLPSGKVLVVGGYYKDGVWEYQRNSAELYNPATGTWLAAAILGLARAYHTATLLPSGKVLVAGGYNYNDGHLTSAEIYDPANGTWSPTGELVYSRASHTATLLPSGKVLVTGGWGYDTIHSSAEIYDPATGTWTETAYFPGYQGRAGHTATLLPSGKVLAAAGSVGGDPDNTAELYDPGLGFSGAWRPYIEPFEGTPILSPGGYLYFQGAGLRGKSEASGGGTNNSSTGYPLVQVRRLDSERILWLPPSSGSFSDTEFTSANFQDVQDGWCLITVITNGIPSLSRFGRFAGGSPTGVELASFTAAWDKKRVVLKWETYTEKNNVGFYLWRTEAGQDAYTRLTRDLIPARGTATMGAAYSYADYAVVRGREYRYKLEDVDTKGASTFHGPVSAAAGPGKKTKEK